MEPEQTQEEKPMTEFELCRELHKYGFPAKHHDEAFYYIRPDVLFRQDNADCLKAEDKRTTLNLQECIYLPSTDDFVDFLGSALQQVIQTERSGWFAYTWSTLGEGITTRSGGTTMWLALANVCLARFMEKNHQIPMEVPESDNVQESLTSPEHETD